MPRMWKAFLLKASFKTASLASPPGADIKVRAVRQDVRQLIFAVVQVFIPYYLF